MDIFKMDRKMPNCILVVDDNETNLMLIRKIFKLEGYEILTEESAEGALKLIMHSCPDMVLLDVMMPDMNGFELCRQIRATPGCASIPVIMLTAADSEADRREAMDAGATALLGKPFDMDHLRASIHYHLQGA
jgi:DNA-binding response OmpR family regulator